MTDKRTLDEVYESFGGKSINEQETLDVPDKIWVKEIEFQGDAKGDRLFLVGIAGEISDEKFGASVLVVEGKKTLTDKIYFVMRRNYRSLMTLWYDATFDNYKSAYKAVMDKQDIKIQDGISKHYLSDKVGKNVERNWSRKFSIKDGGSILVYGLYSPPDKQSSNGKYYGSIWIGYDVLGGPKPFEGERLNIEVSPNRSNTMEETIKRLDKAVGKKPPILKNINI